MTLDEQTALFRVDEDLLPLAVAELLLLYFDIARAGDPFEGNWVWCREGAAFGYRVVLGWRAGKLVVNARLGDDCHNDVWLASATFRGESHTANS